VRLPRTIAGWVKLTWLTLRRCPTCHRVLQRDWPLHEQRDELWCIPCGFVRFPRGFWNALRWNKRAQGEAVSA
jgi:hypothetical protein